MRVDILPILETLDNLDNTALVILKDAALALKSTGNTDQFIKKLTAEMGATDCLHCDNQPFCRFYLTFAFLKQGETNRAKSFIEEAIEGFRVRGMAWNEAMAYWLTGMIMLQEGEHNLAERNLEEAIKILTPKVKEFQIKSNYGKANLCKIYIEQIRQAHAEAHSAPTPKVKKQDEINTPATLTPEIEGYLVVPWIPIYEQVQAGTNGPIWAELPKLEKMEIPLVLLQKQWHSVHSLRYSEMQITLTSDRQYAWVRVHGDSMNKVKPVPIHDGDYVLFYKAQHPERNEIVIAAIPENHGSAERAYMIKRYKKDEYLLTSETSRKGKEYDPIPLTQDFQIIGIVVAVAKPKTKPGAEFDNQNEASLPLMITKGMRQQLLNQGYSEDDISHMTPQQAWDNIDEDELFQNLLIKVLGDHEAANRLIEHEQSQHPRSSRKELIEFAILKWEKDNR